MKSHPMLFSAPMIRALLNGSKNQTRRIVKDQLFACLTGDYPHDRQAYCDETILGFCKWKDGDQIWVKETFSPWADNFTKSAMAGNFPVIYRADYDEGTKPLEVGGCEHWKPSIFMPRKYSRIALEITGVHVERLNNISTDDAEVEGAMSWWNNIPLTPMSGREILHPKEAYKRLWESINGKASWAINPWVWKIVFKKL